MRGRHRAAAGSHTRDHGGSLPPFPHPSFPLSQRSSSACGRCRVVAHGRNRWWCVAASAWSSGVEWDTRLRRGVARGARRHGVTGRARPQCGCGAQGHGTWRPVRLYFFYFSKEGNTGFKAFLKVGKFHSFSMRSLHTSWCLHLSPIKVLFKNLVALRHFDTLP